MISTAITTTTTTSYHIEKPQHAHTDPIFNVTALQLDKGCSQLQSMFLTITGGIKQQTHSFFDILVAIVTRMKKKQ